MAETMGSLIDKLTIVNLKIWSYEDIKRIAKDDHTIAEATRKTNILNQQRSDLIQEIDKLFLNPIQMKSYDNIKNYGGSKDSK